MIIEFTYAGKKVTVRLPRGVDDVTIKEPPPGGEGLKAERPSIILTDKT
jgi:hypothetical protein